MSRKTEDAPANPFKGEAEAVIDGKRVIFCLTIGALADLSAAFNTRNNLQLFARLQGELVEYDDPESGKRSMIAAGPSLQDLPAIVAALSGGAVTIDQARQIKPAEFTPLMKAVGQAIIAAFPESGEKKSADVATTTEIPTPTSPSTDISDSPSLT